MAPVMVGKTVGGRLMRAGSRTGRGGVARPRLIALACILPGLTCVLPAGAGAGSGGAGVARRPSATGGSRPRAVSNPLGSRGMWIWYVSRSSGGSPAVIGTVARRYGLSTVFVKSGDGSGYWPQFDRSLVSALHADGLRVCAWQYVYGVHPILEAEVGATAVRAGADCLVIDAESEYEGRYVQAQRYLQKLRQLIGAGFPVALAGFPYVDYHPAFPYSVFLGPGGAQYDVPQMYWHDIGASVDQVYAHTYSYNLPYGRPIDPLGEVAGNPPPGQVIRFRQLSRSYGAPGVSWWDWQECSPRDWSALARPVGNLAGYAPRAVLPTLSRRGAGGTWAGDLVVWAQEHLVRAGFPLVIDGDFGPNTEAAVQRFQAAHSLPSTGLLDAATWQALLRYPPATVTWSTRKGKTTATVARARLVLPPPRSARLPARRYEIPPHLGAGPPPRAAH